MSTKPSELVRSFSDLPGIRPTEDQDSKSLRAYFGSRDQTWGDLLKAKRVVIVSEAGVGKSYECQRQQRCMWDSGASAFFLELAALGTTPLTGLLDTAELERFEAWKAAESEHAYFFLDSIDELRLTARSFDTTLKLFASALGDNLGRACIVLTARPGAEDREIIERRLPVPRQVEVVAPQQLFMDAAMRVQPSKERAASEPTYSRYVALAPLDVEQWRVMAIQQGVRDPDALIAAIEAEHAQELAKRPLDFIDLCADWIVHGRIRKHTDQMETSIGIKLKPRSAAERREWAELTPLQAREGAERLALAAWMTRRFTLWHGTQSERASSDSAINPQDVLRDWSESQVLALLERPLFGFATYGRVRFQNQSFIEYLTATRLHALHKQGLSPRTLHRMLFATTSVCEELVRPSMEPIAAWLALWLDPIFEEILRREPTVLLRHGDPGSLDPQRQAGLLERYVQTYGSGGWRGLRITTVQCRRLSSSALVPTIRRLWSAGIENSEVREMVLEVVGTGKLAECADIAYEVAAHPRGDSRERLLGLEALVALGDRRLEQLLDSFVTVPGDWPSDLAASSIAELFPEAMTVPQLLGALRCVCNRPGGGGGIENVLPNAISRANFPPAKLEELRQGLMTFIVEGCEWDASSYRVKSKRGDLLGALARICELQLRDRVEGAPLARSIAGVLQMSKEDYYSDDESPALRQLLNVASEPMRSAVFWAQFDLLMSLMKDAHARHYQMSSAPAMQLSVAQDLGWLQRSLADASRPLEARRAALECVIELAQVTDDRVLTLEQTRPFIGVEPELITRMEELLQAFANPPSRDEWLERSAERKELEARKQAKHRAEWDAFWHELLSDEGKPFTAVSLKDTAHDLWKVMSGAPNDDRFAGWNRGWLERVFGRELVERIRQVMIGTWRLDKPTLTHERDPDKINWYYTSWRVGLAGVFAEAEDTDWARKLMPEEAELAMRYAVTALNGLPPWVADLAESHPQIVKQVLLPELNGQLGNTDPQAQHSSMLQYLEHAQPVVIAIFIGALRQWVMPQLVGDDAGNAASSKFERSMLLLLEHGEVADADHIRAAALRLMWASANPEQIAFWLPWLMRLDPTQAVEEMEQLAAKIDPAKDSAVSRWLGALFGHYATHSAATPALLNNPALLCRLTLLAYRHVPPADDMIHQGARESGSSRSEDARYARSQLLKALLDTRGPEAWLAKLTFAQDPLAEHFRDRALVLARQGLAQEADESSYSVSDVLRLESELVAALATRADMAFLLEDRLDDIDDLLRQTASPRETWARVDVEREMRRLVSRELILLAHGAYSVSQEEVTGEEKETDIRMRSTSRPIEAVIELKIGDKPYTYADFSEALHVQLVGKYMAPEERRVGCLLISLAKTRTWEHPSGDGPMIGIDEVVGMLREEAAELVKGLGYAAMLNVRVLDLRPVVFGPSRKRSQKRAVRGAKAAK